MLTYTISNVDADTIADCLAVTHCKLDIKFDRHSKLLGYEERFRHSQRVFITEWLGNVESEWHS